jgi:DNA-binding protein HU-beta
MMNKSDLILQIALGADISQEKAEGVLDVFLRIIQVQLEAGESVQMVGFGTFTAQERTARMGRNPKTGEQIQIGASRSVKFSAGKAFKEELNQ